MTTGIHTLREWIDELGQERYDYDSDPANGQDCNAVYNDYKTATAFEAEANRALRKDRRMGKDIEQRQSDVHKAKDLADKFGTLCDRLWNEEGA